MSSGFCETGDVTGYVCASVESSETRVTSQTTTTAISSHAAVSIVSNHSTNATDTHRSLDTPVSAVTSASSVSTRSENTVAMAQPFHRADRSLRTCYVHESGIARGSNPSITKPLSTVVRVVPNVRTYDLDQIDTTAGVIHGRPGERPMCVVTH